MVTSKYTNSRKEASPMFKYYVPDAYWHSKGNGLFPSHEAICVLNVAPEAAYINIMLYFEDRDKIGNFTKVVLPERTMHIRMDKLTNDQGQPVPVDVPYAIELRSDLPLIVQYTRLDTSQPEMALMTTMVKEERVY
jgi:hypothetical protein